MLIPKNKQLLDVDHAIVIKLKKAKTNTIKRSSPAKELI
jgi:hypothetical protein